MKIRATRTFLNDIGIVRRGAEVDIRDVQARYLIDKGRAVAIEEDGTEVPVAEKPSKPKPKGKTIQSAAALVQGD